MNYTAADDCALARAWLRTWEDPIIGLKQKSLDFKKVTVTFAAPQPPTYKMRTLESLKARIKLSRKRYKKDGGGRLQWS